jgi:hypothetical protein
MSPYQAMGNNPILYNDPDGDFIPQLVGGVVGGALNVFNNWDKILSNPVSAFGYAATGIGAGIVATLPGGLAASRAILSIGNVATDLASGNLPKFEGISDVAGYVGGTAFDAFSTTGASKAFGQITKTSLKKAALKAGKEFVEEGAFSLIGEAELAEMTLRWHGQEIGAGIFVQVNDKAINWGARAAGSIGMGAVSTSLGSFHQHHSYPKYLGGDPKQLTITIAAHQHNQLHKDMND